MLDLQLELEPSSTKGKLIFARNLFSLMSERSVICPRLAQKGKDPAIPSLVVPYLTFSLREAPSGLLRVVVFQCVHRRETGPRATHTDTDTHKEKKRERDR